MCHHDRLQSVLMKGHFEIKTPQILLKTCCREPKFPEQGEPQGCPRFPHKASCCPFTVLWLRKGSHPCLVYSLRGRMPLGSPKGKGTEHRSKTKSYYLSTLLSPVLSAVTSRGQREVVCEGTLHSCGGWPAGNACHLAMLGLQTSRAALDEAEG